VASRPCSTYFLQIIQRPRNGLLIYLLNSDGVLTGLMVEPQSFGSQIEKREIVLASVVLLVHPIVVLIQCYHPSFPDPIWNQ